MRRIKFIPVTWLGQLRGRGWSLLLTAGLALLFAGCTPEGPASLLEGRKLLAEGQPRAALLPLHDAVQLMRTNGLAWSHLGLAYHQTDQLSNAATCYVQALRWNRDLVDVRYNLGEAYLALGQPDAAKLELIAFTVQRNKSLPGWLARGTAELRGKDPAAALNSFSTALRLSPTNPTALNNLGVALVQRGRPREAAPYFSAALQQLPGFPAALRNQAIVQQIHLRDLPAARESWRQYLALTSPPADLDSIQALVNVLSEPPPRPVANTNLVATPVAPLATNAPRLPRPPATNPPVAPPATTPVVRRPPPTITPPPATALTAPPPRPLPPVVTSAPPALEVVVLPEPTVLPSAGASLPAPPSVPTNQPTTSSTPVGTNSPAVPREPDSSPEPEQKRGFFAKINPANLFKKKPKAELRPTRLPEDSTTGQPVTQVRAATNLATPAIPPPPLPLPAPRTTPAGPPPIPRYTYARPARPAAGNRAEAERAFRTAVEAHQSGRALGALDDYQRATRADPQFFAAWNNLGLALHEVGRYEQALTALELALGLDPDSTEARYNLGVALRDAGYPLDAASEFQQVLATSPADVRTHLALGNLYAQRLRDTAKARAHYRRVLDLDPDNPLAGNIRTWLRNNPG
jgi:tetratricopeptide (TPR) repeat protein